MAKTQWEKASPCQKNCNTYTDKHLPENFAAPNVFALIVAAGKGLRMKSNTKKQYMLLNGIPVLTHTILAFYKNKCINNIIVLVPKEDIEYCKLNILPPFHSGSDSNSGIDTVPHLIPDLNFTSSLNPDCKSLNRIHFVPGGRERQDSVYNGLKYIKKNLNCKKDPVIMIHDGVRPLISQELLHKCLNNVIKLKACIPGLKIPDTVKQVSKKKLTHNTAPAEDTEEETVDKTIDRKNLYLIQTPQCFFLSPLIRAFEHAELTSFTGTDDASVMEHTRQAVHIIQGDKKNIKITTPEDMEFARYYISARTKMAFSAQYLR